MQDAVIGENERLLVPEGGAYERAHPAHELKAQDEQHADPGDAIGFLDVEGVEVRVVFRPSEAVLAVVLAFIGLKQLARVHVKGVRDEDEGGAASALRLQLLGIRLRNDELNAELLMGRRWDVLFGASRASCDDRLLFYFKGRGVPLLAQRAEF